MFVEEFQKQHQQFSPGTSVKKADNAEQDTLYPPIQKNKPEFKAIDPNTVNSHQKNQGAYKRSSELNSKQQVGGGTQGGGGTVQKMKQTANTPTDEAYKKMTIGKEPISSSSLEVVSEKDEYYTKNTPKINFEVQFNSPLPQSLKARLEVIAFYMINKTENAFSSGDFVQNSITSFAVSGKSFDLTKLSDAEKAKYGGNTVFEFMRLNNFKDGDKDTACIQVRELGQHQEVAVDATMKQKHEDHFKKFFTLDPSFSDTKEIERLYSAVYKLPENVLSSIPNTPFMRSAVNIDRGGNRHPETIAQHVMNGLGETSITVFDSAFNNDDSTRYGDSNAGFFGAFEQAILHEIGHAFNGRKITKALRDDTAAGDAVSKGLRESIACGERKGKRRACDKIDDKLVKLRAAETDAETAKAAARTETGMGYDIAADDLYVDKNPDAAFRKALDKDGKKPITQYGAKEIEENYAELFSLYFIDEARLKKMRPAIHEYFATNYPKNP